MTPSVNLKKSYLFVLRE